MIFRADSAPRERASSAISRAQAAFSLEIRLLLSSPLPIALANGSCLIVDLFLNEGRSNSGAGDIMKADSQWKLSWTCWRGLSRRTRFLSKGSPVQSMHASADSNELFCPQGNLKFIFRFSEPNI